MYLIIFCLLNSCASSEAETTPEKQTSFILPTYNGECLFTEEDALDDLNKLKLDSNLDFQINILYQTGPADCVGKVWGSNLDQGKVVDTDINNIDLIVGKEDLNDQSRGESLPNEYDRTIDLGLVEGSILMDLSSFQDYATDIDYLEGIQSYLMVGHSKSVIYKYDISTQETNLWLDFSKYVGTTGNWETGLLSLDHMYDKEGYHYFLVSYTDKELNLALSIFEIGKEDSKIKKEKDLFISPQSGAFDFHYGGNIERVNEETWIFGVGDQDTMYGLYENPLRTDILSGKLIMFSVDDEFNIYNANTPTYDPDIFSPIGGDLRPKAILAEPAKKSNSEIKHILALGFRNPWGFSIYENYLFVPDVGLNKVEELNILNLNLNQPMFFGWPHREGTFYYAQDRVGKFWDYEITPAYQHSSEDGRCANIGGAVHRSQDSPGWNGYFFFIDQCSFEIFIINHKADNVFRSSSSIIKSAPVVIKNDKDGNILLSTFTGQIYLLDLKTLNLQY